MQESGFLIFLLFYSEFSSPRRVRTEFENKIFFLLFFVLSHPVLAKNNTGKRFLNFFEFFCYFIQNFLPRAEYERNSRLNFFSRFLSLSHPVPNKNNARKRFFMFSNFFAIFFSEFSSPSRVWTEFGTKIFFSFSAYHFLNFFAILFRIFFPEPSMNGIQD